MRNVGRFSLQRETAFSLNFGSSFFSHQSSILSFYTAVVDLHRNPFSIKGVLGESAQLDKVLQVGSIMLEICVTI